ncbi:hypothetical protein PTKIN_Ptkin10aG0042600 [Pterospermum kingtungense]
MRQVEIHNACCVCGHQGESLFLMMYGCPFSRKVWEIQWPVMRNYCFQHNVCKTLAAAMFEAKDICKKFMEVQSSHISLPDLHDICWQPSTQGHIKLNVDAVVHHLPAAAMLEVVIKDQQGLTLYSGATWMPDVESPLCAELQAIRFGLELAKDLKALSLTAVLLM